MIFKENLLAKKTVLPKTFLLGLGAGGKNICKGYHRAVQGFCVSAFHPGRLCCQLLRIFVFLTSLGWPNSLQVAPSPLAFNRLMEADHTENVLPHNDTQQNLSHAGIERVGGAPPGAY